MRINYKIRQLKNRSGYLSGTGLQFSNLQAAFIELQDEIKQLRILLQEDRLLVEDKE